MGDGFILPGDLALTLGVREWQLTRLRRAGKLPEFVKVGRFNFCPVGAVESIRARLTREGIIRPRGCHPNAVSVAAPGAA